VFRLGDAAQPFGWSTVIADFNRDGKPDLAVADHIARRTSRYAYRLEFSISGQTPRDVTFESSHEAVTISVADVDRDNDLDIIVGTPFSREIVAIWLNDGHGHFTAGDVRQLPATVEPVESLDSADRPIHVAASEWTPRRADEPLPETIRLPLVHTASRFAFRRASLFRSAFPSSRTNPRAPPSIPFEILS